MNILAITLLTLFAQNASIRGVVVRGTNDPLSKATVELRGEDSDARVLDSTTTEGDGQFVFQSVRPGRYRLVAKRQGYFRSPLTLTLASGQQLSGLQLSMTPTGAINGRITDNSGVPLGNIEVRALRPSYPQGRRVLTFVASVRTNDLGEYRLFWLPPGRYYVAAVHPDAQDPIGRLMGTGLMLGAGTFFASTGSVDPAASSPQLKPPGSRRTEVDAYMPIYFGGTADEQLAVPIDLRSGADFGGVNIIVTPIRRRHVRGVVVDGATGRPDRYATVGRSAEGAGRDEVEADRDNGSFEIVLPPGQHNLRADAAGGHGSVNVQVGNADIQNLTIVTRPGFDVAGRIAIEGAAIKDFDLASIRIMLLEDPPVPVSLSYALYSNPTPDGAFRLDATPGDYRVNVAPLLNVVPDPRAAKLPAALENAYVKSIRMGAVDVLNTGLHLEKPPETPIEIVIGTNPGIIEGTVLNDRQQAVDDVSVVLMPGSRHRTELYAAAITGPLGRFRFDRVPPGDYKIFAWSEVENGMWYDAEFMKNYENFAGPIRLAEGSKQEVRITVIP